MPSSHPENQQKKLFGGVLVLLPAALFTKVVGLCYKIPLIAIVGVAGMAYFLAAYHIYSMLFVLSATGLPTALSLAVAKAVAAGNSRATGRIFRVSLLLFLSLGLSGTALLLAFAPALAAQLSMPDAAPSIVAIAPALLLSAFIGAAKGYFQGLHIMWPTALSEVLEAAGKLGFGLALALLAKGRGASTPMVAAYAILGITVGLALAALVLAFLLILHACKNARKSSQGERPSRRAVFATLCRVALPVTVSASVMSLTTLIDTALISGRLQAAGYAPAVANGIYSSYGNLAMPLYNLIPSLLSPITLALMPLLGAAHAGGDVQGGRRALASALRLTVLCAIPSAMGLAVFAEPLLSLIYRGQGEAIGVAAPLLSLLALSVLPTALITLTGAALQATGHTLSPIAAMGVGAAVKLTLEYMLLSMPAVGIYGAPISTLCCNLTILGIQTVQLCRVMRHPLLSVGALFRPLGASALAVGIGAVLYVGLAFHGGGDWCMLPVLLLTVLLFVPLALRLGAVEQQDILALPMGERICPLLQKMKLLK